MHMFGTKPYTSITVKVNQLCGNNYETDTIELFIGDLLALINLQSTGPSEASRAIRKNIKYGSKSEKNKALTILELLVLNGGLSIGRVFANDAKLISVLKGVIYGTSKSGNEITYDKDTVKRIRNIALGWKTELRGLNGFEPLTCLYKSIPKTKPFSEPTRTLKKQSTNNNVASTVLSDNFQIIRKDSFGNKAPPRPNTLSPSIVDDETTKSSHMKRMKTKYADERFKIPQINYKLEGSKIKAVISDGHTDATALENAILTLPLETDVSTDDFVKSCFQKCRITRRSVLKYLQLVGAGDIEHKLKEVRELENEFLGNLISSNDRLVNALMRYDRACGIVGSDRPFDCDYSSSTSDGDFCSSESSEDEAESVKGSVDSKSYLGNISSIAQGKRDVLPRNNLQASGEENPFGDPL